MIVLPIVASLSDSLGCVIDKYNLNRSGTDPKSFVTYAFLILSIIMLPFAYFFFDLKAGAFTPLMILYFWLMVLSSAIANTLYVYGFKAGCISETQPVRMLEPFFTIILATAFFPSERNPLIFVAAIVAALALVAAHVRRHHFEFNRYLFAILLSDLFISLDLIIGKRLLDFYSPFTLYFARCLGLAIVLLTVFRPNLEMPGYVAKPLFAACSLYVISRIAVYYAFGMIGILATILVLTLNPLFVYVFDYFVIGERIPKRTIAASVVIVLCIVIAQICSAPYV